MARKTPAELITLIAAFIDNINGEITEQMLRDFFTDLKDSFTHLDDFEDHLDDFDTAVDALTSAIASKADATATTAALDDKQNIASIFKSGSVLDFTEIGCYGRYGTPSGVSAFTFAGPAGCKPGTVVTIIHQAGAEPSFGSEFHKLPTSGTYANGAINYITLTFVDTSTIIYRIDRH